VKVLTATDIVGQNDCGLIPGEEKLFLPIGATIGCIGQSLCLVVADTPAHAKYAATLVTATYAAPASGAKPVCDITQAVAEKSFFPSTPDNPYITNMTRPGGNVASAMSKAANKVSGSVNTQGQRHFYMETQNAIAFPIEFGKILRVTTSAQFLDQCQTVIKNVTGLPANSINVTTRRSGGAFGGKISRSLHVAAAASLAAYVVAANSFMCFLYSFVLCLLCFSLCLFVCLWFGRVVVVFRFLHRRLR